MVLRPRSTPAARPPASRGQRRLLAGLVAVVIALGTTAPAIALAPESSSAGGAAGSRASLAYDGPVVGDGTNPTGTPRIPSLSRTTRAAALAAASRLFDAIGPTAIARSEPAKSAPPTSSSRFQGRNHVWIPALGIDRSISSFPCSRRTVPGNYVYRWGCAGTNNVYLLGHAYNVFKALHDAYYDGRLKVGLTAVYADASGNVRTYRVAWWRVVRPTTAAKWAWAPQSRPSMTLQTCLGAHSEYRLMVRLVAVR